MERLGLYSAKGLPKAGSDGAHMTDLDVKPAEPGSVSPPAGEQDPSAIAGTNPPARSRIELPEGWLGMLLLVIVAAVCSGLLVSYWPMLTGSGDDILQERIDTLETRVGQIAAGHAGDAASAIFGDMRKQIMTDEDRIAAAEARLSALEKSAPATTATGDGTETADTGTLRAQLGALNASFNDVSSRLAKIEGGQAGQPSLAELAGKLAADEARLAATEAANATTSGQNATLMTRLQTLEASTPPDLPQKLASFTTKTDAAALDARIMKLESANSAETLQHAATLLALAELSRAAATPQPYVLEIKTFATLAPDDAALSVLSAYADKGVPTRAALVQRFPADAQNALAAERANADGSFLDHLWANIKGLVTIRRVGNVAGNDTDATLARATLKLETGDFAGAVGEVRTLKGTAAKNLQPWRDDAQARLAVDTALAEANARIVTALANTKAATQAATTPTATAPAAATSATTNATAP